MSRKLKEKQKSPNYKSIFEVTFLNFLFYLTKFECKVFFDR